MTTRPVAYLRAHATLGDCTQMSATTGERHVTATSQSTSLDNIPVRRLISSSDRSSRFCRAQALTEAQRVREVISYTAARESVPEAGLESSLKLGASR